jgi:hypothetical protein
MKEFFIQTIFKQDYEKLKNLLFRCQVMPPYKENPTGARRQGGRETQNYHYKALYGFWCRIVTRVCVTQELVPSVTAIL